MQLPSHLRLSRHGVWCFRLVLPEVLANAIGQKEIRKSLRTRCPIAAKLLAYHLSGKILPIVREAKKKMGFDPNSIDPKSVKQLIVKGLGIDRKAGTLTAEYVETNPDPEIAALELAGLRAMMEDAPAGQAGNTDADPATAAREYAARYAAAQGIPPEQLSSAEPQSNSRPPCDNLCTIEEALKAFLAHKRDLAAGTLTTYTYRLDLFASLVGGGTKILNKVTKQDCINAAEAFRERSPHMTQRGEGKVVQGKISASTAKDTLTLWQSFFEWAIGTGRYAGDNPIAKIPRPSQNGRDKTNKTGDTFTLRPLKNGCC